MTRPLSRAALIVVTLLVAVFYYGAAGHTDFVEQWGEGSYGLTLDFQTPFVQAVAPGSPADRAGVRAGDRIVAFRGTQEWGRLNSPYAGATQTFTFAHGASAYRATMTAAPAPGFGMVQRIGGLLALIPPTIFLVVAFALVFLRPSIMTWSFYVFAVGYFGTQPVVSYWSHVLSPPAYLALTFVLTTVLGGWAAMPLLPFVLRFPNGDLRGWRHKVDKFVWLLLAVSLAICVYQFFYIWAKGALPPWFMLTEDGFPLAAFALAALIVVKNYSVAPPADRQRSSFLVLGTIASFVAYAVYYVPGLPFAVGQIVGFAVVIMPLCVAYAVFRLRVLDVNFVLNRALAYTTLSVAVIAFVSVLDWLFSRVVSIGRFAIGLELLVTIGIGFLLDRINRAVGSFVDAVFFRARHRAETYLRRAAAALPYATQEEAISEGLVQVPVDALELAAAALYRRSGTAFSGVATSLETPVAPPGFDANHLLVRMLLSSEKSVWLDELRSHLDAENAAIYTIAVPVMVRHELASFTLYGAHRNGAQLDPEEVELLEDLAREASRAYDHVEAVRTRERYAALTAASPETA